MKGTVISLYKFDNGRVTLYSDIPDNMTEQEREELIGTLRQAIENLSPEEALPVSVCIRQLAFGAVLCSPNLREAIRSFRDEADSLLSKF